MKMRFGILALLAVVALPTAAQSAVQSSLQAAVQPSLEAQTAANMAQGDLLYAYDQSAWHVTDAALAAIPKSSMGQLRGYVVTPDDGGFRTTFYGGDTGRHFRMYTAIWTGRAIVRPELFEPAKRQSVTSGEERLIAAKTLALSNLDGLPRCTNANLNIAAIPGSTAQDPVAVYILTPATKTNQVPMGGHHRIDVKDGAVVSKRSFSRSCINLEKPPASNKQGTPVAMMISHLLDPVPTEIHAFAVHSAGLRMYVLIPDGTLYAVDLKAGRAVARKIRRTKP
jgi:hypothetical protein